MKRVYIETSIPSYYYEIRTDAESIVKKNWTCDWWDNHRLYYDVVISPGVIEELEKGDYPTQAETNDLVKNLPVLEINDEIESIVKEYISRHLMPAATGGDALHLAVSSYYQCHFLLTWNCRHLANANKFEHMRHVNTILGLFVPTIVTPYELLFEDEDVKNV